MLDISKLLPYIRSSLCYIETDQETKKTFIYNGIGDPLICLDDATQQNIDNFLAE